jgi:Zn-dependent peptidase ImmA (M78 family)
MKIKDLLFESHAKSNINVLDDFLPFCAKRLQLTQLPKIEIVDDNGYSKEYKSFGGYSPDKKSIVLAIQDRHIADVLRTLAHELTHYKQDMEGNLEDPSAGETGSDQENEANSQAGIIMRDFGRANPKIYE